MPCTKMVSNQIDACIHRFGRAMPSRDDKTVEHFSAYAREWIKRSIPKAQASKMKSFKEWLAKYPAPRAREFLKLFDETTTTSMRDIMCKAFIKWEHYEEPKPARAINSYDDMSKLLLGGLIECFDKCLFSTKFFVKGTNPKEWPNRLEKLFGNQKVNATDFSTFEAHHFDAYSKIVYFAIMHSIRDIPMSKYQRKLIARLILGTNVCKFRDITATIKQRLMSGALWTSSGNGLLNLLFCSYISNPHSNVEDMVKWTNEEFKALFEGDDGIFQGDINDDKIARLGLRLKIEKDHDNYKSAAFCQIMTDERGILFTNPLRAMKKFFALPIKFSNSREAKAGAFIRAKALSYAYLYNDCPVIGPLCHSILQSTKSFDPSPYANEVARGDFDKMTAAKEEKIWLRPPEINDSTRLAVALRFHLSIAAQLEIEAKLQLAKWPIEHSFDDMLNGCDYHHERNFVSQYRKGHVMTHRMPTRTIEGHLEASRVDREFDKSYRSLSLWH